MNNKEKIELLNSPFDLVFSEKMMCLPTSNSEEQDEMARWKLNFDRNMVNEYVTLNKFQSQINCIVGY